MPSSRNPENPDYRYADEGADEIGQHIKPFAGAGPSTIELKQFHQRPVRRYRQADDAII